MHKTHDTDELAERDASGNVDTAVVVTECDLYDDQVGHSRNLNGGRCSLNKNVHSCAKAVECMKTKSVPRGLYTACV